MNYFNQGDKVMQDYTKTNVTFYMQELKTDKNPNTCKRYMLQ